MKNNVIDAKIGLQSSKSNRIEYIDAMRGFAILMVVTSHVFIFSFDHNPSVICNWIATFRMPLFFFISGFVLYKSTTIWSGEYVRDFLAKKAKIQLVPTIVFFCLCEYLIANQWQEHLVHSSKGGYWFTLVLFYYFAIYSLLRIILKKSKSNDIFEDIAIVCVGLLICLGIPFLCKTIGIRETNDYLSLRKLHYFLYFGLGTIVKKYYSSFWLLLQKSWFITIALCVSIFGFICFETFSSSLSGTFLVAWKIVLAIAGIVICLVWFYKHENLLSKNTRIGGCMQFIGRRTLDVYLLHYLVLPRQLGFIGAWFEQHSMPFVYFFSGVIVAILVVGVCLLISSIIRISPICAEWLFGVKNK